MLAGFANIANQGQLPQLSLTLLVGGSWLTGELVGARRWFEGLATWLDAAGNDDFGELFRILGAETYPSDSERDAAGTAAPPDQLPYFLHLRNARLLAAATPLPSQGGWVRVRVDEVQAWLIGRLGTPRSGPGS